MEKKYINILIPIVLITLAGILALYFLRSCRETKKIALPQEQLKIKEGKYIPLLKPQQFEENNASEESKGLDKEQLKEINNLSDLNAENLSSQETEKIKEYLDEKNEEFQKMPSLKEVDGLKQKRIIIQ